MRKILLLPNFEKDKNLSHTLKAAEILKDAGAQPYMREVDIGVISGGVSLPGYVERISGVPYSRGMDAVAVFGGDGTILEAAGDASGEDVPLVGINLGKVGFMSGLEPCEMEEKLPLLASREPYATESRMMMDVAILRGGEMVHKETALNDAVLSKGEITKVIRLTVSSDGRKLTSFSGDGVIIATPTGSTAYSMAAGGPIVEPEAGCFLVTPICAHTLFAQSFVIDPKRLVHIDIDPHGIKEPYLSIDGRDGLPLSPGDEVVVTRSQRVTSLICLGAASFYETISRKLSPF